MDTSTWIAIWLPIFVLLFVILPAEEQRRRALMVKNRRRGKGFMANELLKKYLGRRCAVSTGSFGSTVTGVITAVEDNWVEVVTNKGPQLLNADYVTNIAPSEKKPGKEKA